MHIFLYELRSRWKSLIVWSVLFWLFLWLSMVKFDSFGVAGQDINQLLDNFPPTIQAVFGMDGLNLATLSGYVGTVYLYAAVLAAIFAGNLGASVIAREEQDKTAEFLYTRPLGRQKIFYEKILAVGVYVGALWMTLTLGFHLAIAPFSPTDTDQRFIWLIAGSLLLIMLCSAGVGLFAGSLLSKNSGRLVAFFVLGSYLATTIAVLSQPLEWLHFVSVFSWFQAADILQTMALEPLAIVGALGLTFSTVLGAAIWHEHRDIHL